MSTETMDKEQVTPLGISNTPLDPEFKRRIQELCGENVLSCYQCGECTAGCPAAFAMDISPNQVMRMAQLGMMDEVIGSSAIWMCAGCETCSTRCPRGVALSKVMDACRQIAAQEGKKPKEPNVVSFHEEFLKEIARNGRVHEMSLAMMLKLRTKKFFEDIFAGIQMFLKGKFALIPNRIKGRKEVKSLFKK